MLLLGHDVAFFGRREAALRRQAQAFERYIFGSFLNASFDGFLVLKFGEFARDQAEYNRLIFDEAQRFKTAGAFRVVFQEETVDAAVAEEIWNGVKFSYDDINKVIAVTERELSK